MSNEQLHGVFAPITTPFSINGDIIYDHLIHNIKRYATSGISGFLVFGSNGENKSLTYAEKKEILKLVASHKAPNQILMVGSIYESTRETIDFALMAQEAGANYITLLPPSYFKSAMKDDVLYRYFSDVASSLTIPCLLYKAPQFSGGLDLSIGLIKKCTRHPNIVGIKDSSGGGIEKIQYSVPESFSVLTGSANTFFSALLGGAVGGVLSIANYLPELTMDLYNCIIKNDINRAKELNRQVIALNIEVSGIYGVAGVKCAMDQTGFFGGYPRLPLEPISAEGLHTVKQAIDTVRKQ